VGYTVEADDAAVTHSEWEGERAAGKVGRSSFTRCSSLGTDSVRVEKVAFCAPGVEDAAWSCEPRSIRPSSGRIFTTPRQIRITMPNYKVQIGCINIGGCAFHHYRRINNIWWVCSHRKSISIASTNTIKLILVAYYPPSSENPNQNAGKWDVAEEINPAVRPAESNNTLAPK
jgi:hypothetical protein